MFGRYNCWDDCDDNMNRWAYGISIGLFILFGLWLKLTGRM